MGSALQDVRYALRIFAKNPAFTIVAVLTLALGIGANTAIFSVVNGVLLRPLPFRNADRLVVVGESNPKVSTEHFPASYLNFTDWQQLNHVFDYVAAYRNRTMTLIGKGEPQRLTGVGVASSFFPLLSADAYLGRTLTPDDEKAEGSNVVVISYGLWERLFGGDKAALGQILVLENVPRTIVGVMPRGFRFLNDADFFTPIDVSGQIRQVRGIRFLRVIARLKPGLTLPRAQADMDVVAQGLAKEYPKYDQGWGVAVDGLQDSIVGRVRQGLLVLFGTVGFVLLIACANVANLFLARGASRQKEMAIRAALGAGRSRVIRLLLTEAFLLALASGGVAMIFSLWSIDALRALSPASLPRLDEIRVDAPVFGFTFLITLLTGFLFGLVPARQASRVDLQEALRESGRAIAGGRHYLRRLLMVSEVALSLILLVGAGLLGRSFVRLLSVNPGFQAVGLISLDLRLPQYKYAQDSQQANFFRELLERAQALPGVRSVALTSALPLSGNESKNSIGIEGKASEEAVWVTFLLVSPDYFRTMGIPLLQGRAFTGQDVKSAHAVALINEGMARKYWPEGDAVGKHLLLGKEGTLIVGVVGNVKDMGLAAPDTPQTYLPFWQQPVPWATVVARADGDPLTLVAPLRAIVQSLDKNQPVEHIQTMQDLLSRSVAQPRIIALLLSAFSLLSLVLVAVGIYGVVSYSVSQRTHEIGIRMALGAERSNVFALVLTDAVKSTLLGVGIGLLGAFLLTRVLVGLLFGITTTDPFTVTAVTAFLIGIALLASYLPARRATRVDPIVALRQE
jgi:putative ABC transport system permease protein